MTVLLPRMTVMGSDCSNEGLSTSMKAWKALVMSTGSSSSISLHRSNTSLRLSIVCIREYCYNDYMLDPWVRDKVNIFDRRKLRKLNGIDTKISRKENELIRLKRERVRVESITFDQDHYIQDTT